MLRHSLIGMFTPEVLLGVLCNAHTETHTHSHTHTHTAVNPRPMAVVVTRHIRCHAIFTQTRIKGSLKNECTITTENINRLAL